MSKIELLAPAGSMSALKAAVINGADAVYLGLEDFSARNKATNFNLDQLKEALDYAHLFGVRIYIAMNTLIKDSEMDNAFKLLKSAYRMGADAFIIQDLGFLQRIKENLPNVEVHISTQAGVHNHLGAAVMQSLGVKRVVLSRETTLEDIKLIRDKTNIEIEAFVHGALCISFSGNCYFSSLICSNSGNRGKCLQFCRKKYTLQCGDKSKIGYYLSAKDLSLINNLKNLIDVGVTSLKIEGRMRRDEYVGETVRIYKKALEQIDSNVANDEIDKLKLMFNRGDYTKAHLFESTAKVIYPSIQNHIGLKIGEVIGIQDKTAHLKLSKKLQIGDGIKFVSKDGSESGAGLVSSAENKTTFKGAVKIGDAVHLTSDNALLIEINSRKRKLEIYCRAEFLTGKVPKLALDFNGLIVEIIGKGKIDSAKNKPIEREQIVNILLSDSDSEVGLLIKDLIIDNNIFVPISVIKDLKRNAISQIKQKILEKHIENNQNNSTMTDITSNKFTFEPFISRKNNIFVQIDRIDILSDSISNKSDFVVFNPSKYDIDLIKCFAEKYKNKAVLNLPNVARGADLALLKNIVDNSGIEIFIVNNVFGLEMCKDKKIIFGIFMNMYNSEIACEKINSIESERFSDDAINYIYGSVPLMTFAHCAKKEFLGSCEKKCNGYDNIFLQDEMSNKFYMRHVRVSNCYAQLINSVPIYLADKAKVAGVKNIFIDFTECNQVQISKIFAAIENGDIIEKFTRSNFGKVLK